jgi:hypothetical protein
MFSCRFAEGIGSCSQQRDQSALACESDYVRFCGLKVNLVIYALQIQADIALMMRESESQQQLLKELQARECSMFFVLFQFVNPKLHLF